MTANSTLSSGLDLNQTYTWTDMENRSFIELIKWDENMMTFYYVAKCIETVLGVSGNILILMCMKKLRFWTQPAYLLLTSVAISDILRSLQTPLSLVEYSLDSSKSDKSQLWRVNCLMKECITTILANFGNTYSVFLVSLDRFISVNFPIFYIQKITPQIVAKGLVTFWLWTIVYCLSSMPYAYSSPNGIDCIYSEFLPSWLSYTIYLQWALLLILIILFYIRITYVAYVRSEKRSRNKVVPSQEETEQANQLCQQQKNILQMMVILVGMHVFTMLPILCLTALTPATPPDWFNNMYLFATIVWYLNPIINPCVYALKNNDIKMTLRKIMKGNR